MKENQTFIERIEELEELLRWVHGRLEDMTTNEFAHGGDKDIRERIAKLLDIQEATK
jgi:uncharacterized protein (UPF0335 family)